ncbi:MAG: YicC/YloC family endoribonuclease [Planctomycetota bacterium]|nr:YicC/YloC family endoribonuclease [Planctomycetota bacterium]
MIRSMTGFGDATAEHEGVHYFLEVRSLNAKYFKGLIRLPEDLQGLEAELEPELRRRLTRGSVTLLVKCSDSSKGAAYVINHQALNNYIEQIQRSAAVSSGAATVDVGSLLPHPRVLQPPANEEDRIESARKVFLDLTSRACDRLIAMREREGQALREDLMKHHAEIAERLSAVDVRAPVVVDEYQKRLRTRVETMLRESGVAVEPADLIREVAVYAERSDIAEELSRLKAHLVQFEELITSDDDRPIGRTLDFLSQEMLREANTIASKSNDAEIAREIVVIKGAIDRIKEQVQNVE